MDPIELYLKDGTKAVAQICGRCCRIWGSDDSAERCCKCHYCGESCDWSNGVMHMECRRKESEAIESKRMDKAELVPDYDGPFIWNERVFTDADELLDYVDAADLPEFGYCCKSVVPIMRVDYLIERVADQMHEDWEEIEVTELAAAIALWNEANKDNVTVYEDTKRKWSKENLLALAGTDTSGEGR